MPQLSLIALPGFLGRTEDWLQFSCSKCTYHSAAITEEPSFRHFARHFNRNRTANTPRVLLGYSLGARLAMHILLESPEFWDKAILISGHPGLESDEEREMRCQQDALWANAFIEEPWHELMAKWEGQGVFKSSSHAFNRQEHEYSRTRLAHHLTYYSLGRQENLRSQLAELNLPILWLTGLEDEKFSKIADSIFLKHPKSQKIALPGGHRLPWDNENDFKKVVYSFLQDV